MAIRQGITVIRLIMDLGSTIGHTAITVTGLIIITGVVIAGVEADTGAAIMAVGAVAEATGVDAEAGVAGKPNYAYRTY